MADLAQRAATSGATVVRLAAKLGYDGFTSLQSAVQDELGQRLRPAAERIRELPPSDVLGRVRAVELDNVAGTLEAASTGAFEEVGGGAGRRDPTGSTCSPATRRAASACCSPTSCRCCGAACRSGSGPMCAWPATSPTSSAATCWSPSTIAATSAGCSTRPVWPASAAPASWRCATARSSPLADLAWCTFVVRAESAGPFDSHVGTVALINALIAGAAARRQQPATDRLDGIEAAWREYGALFDE